MTQEQRLLYEELKVRRDVAKFVFDMGVLRALSSTNTAFVKVKEYESGMISGHFWDERLQGIVETAMSLGVDSNVIRDPDISERVNSVLSKGADKKTVGMILRVLNELYTYENSCPDDARTLCGELLDCMYPIQQGKYPISEEVAVAVISTLIDGYTYYDKKSKEYRILRGYPASRPYFREWVKKYFFELGDMGDDDYDYREVLENLESSRESFRIGPVSRKYSKTTLKRSKYDER